MGLIHSDFTLSHLTKLNSFHQGSLERQGLDDCSFVRKLPNPCKLYLIYPMDHGPWHNILEFVTESSTVNFTNLSTQQTKLRLGGSSYFVQGLPFCPFYLSIRSFDSKLGTKVVLFLLFVSFSFFVPVRVCVVVATMQQEAADEESGPMNDDDAANDSSDSKGTSISSEDDEIEPLDDYDEYFDTEDGYTLGFRFPTRDCNRNVSRNYLYSNTEFVETLVDNTRKQMPSIRAQTVTSNWEDKIRWEGAALHTSRRKHEPTSASLSSPAGKETEPNSLDSFNHRLITRGTSRTLHNAPGLSLGSLSLPILWSGKTSGASLAHTERNNAEFDHLSRFCQEYLRLPSRELKEELQKAIETVQQVLLRMESGEGANPMLKHLKQLASCWSLNIPCWMNELDSDSLSSELLYGNKLANAGYAVVAALVLKKLWEQISELASSQSSSVNFAPRSHFNELLRATLRGYREASVISTTRRHTYGTHSRPIAINERSFARGGERRLESHRERFTISHARPAQHLEFSLYPPDVVSSEHAGNFFKSPTLSVLDRLDFGDSLDVYIRVEGSECSSLLESAENESESDSDEEMDESNVEESRSRRNAQKDFFRLLRRGGPEAGLPSDSLLFRDSSQSTELPQSPEMHQLKGRTAVGNFDTVEELSSICGDLILVEYCEESPPALSMPGMCSRMVTYWRPKEDTRSLLKERRKKGEPEVFDDDLVEYEVRNLRYERGVGLSVRYDENDFGVSGTEELHVCSRGVGASLPERHRPPPLFEGQLCPLEVSHDKPPILGNVSEGDSVTIFENNLGRAPVFRHRAPATDFLLTLLPTRLSGQGESGDDEGNWKSYCGILQRIPNGSIWLSGQIEPLQVVWSPLTRDVMLFMADYYALQLRRMFDNPEIMCSMNGSLAIRRDIVRQVFRGSLILVVEALASHVAQKRINKGFLTLCKDAPNEGDLLQTGRLSPENVALMFGMRQGEWRLRRWGLEQANSTDGLDSGLRQIRQLKKKLRKWKGVGGTADDDDMDGLERGLKANKEQRQRGNPGRKGAIPVVDDKMLAAGFLHRDFPQLYSCTETIDKLLKTTPWYLTEEYVGIQFRGQAGFLSLTGPKNSGLGDPSGRQEGFSFLHETASKKHVLTHEEPKKAKRGGTEDDLRRMTLSQLKEELLSLNVPESEIQPLHRWGRARKIKMIYRERSKHEANDERAKKYLDDQRSTHEDRKAEKDVQATSIQDLQRRVLSDPYGPEDSDSDDSSLEEDDDEEEEETDGGNQDRNIYKHSDTPGPKQGVAVHSTLKRLPKSILQPPIDVHCLEPGSLIPSKSTRATGNFVSQNEPYKDLLHLKNDDLADYLLSGGHPDQWCVRVVTRELDSTGDEITKLTYSRDYFDVRTAWLQEKLSINLLLLGQRQSTARKTLAERAAIDYQKLQAHKVLTNFYDAVFTNPQTGRREKLCEYLGFVLRDDVRKSLRPTYKFVTEEVDVLGNKTQICAECLMWGHRKTSRLCPGNKARESASVNHAIVEGRNTSQSAGTVRRPGRGDAPHVQMLSTARKRTRDEYDGDDADADLSDASEDLKEPEEAIPTRKRAKVTKTFEKYHNIFTARTPARSLRIRLENAISDLIHKDYSATGGMLSRPTLLGARSISYASVVRDPISLSDIRKYIVLSDSPDPSVVLEKVKQLEDNELTYAEKLEDIKHRDAKRFRERYRVSKTLLTHFTRWYQGEKRTLLEEFTSSVSSKKSTGGISSGHVMEPYKMPLSIVSEGQNEDEEDSEEEEVMRGE